MIEIHLESGPEITRLLPLMPLTAEAIAPFGAIVEAPAEIGERNLYTKWLGSDRAEMTPRLHVNYVPKATLPIVIDVLEQHPYSAQIFIPIDVAQYVVVVAPSNKHGRPDPALAQAFLAPGSIGVVYRPGIWHAGATVLGRAGSFAVLMWRNDTADDETFCELDASLQVQMQVTKL